MKHKPAPSLIIIIATGCLFLAIALFAGIKLFSGMKTYNTADRTYDEIREMFEKESAPAQTIAKIPDDVTETKETAEEETYPDGFQWNYGLLAAINPEAVGYIRTRGGGEDTIDYPVVQGTDNEYYLTHMFDFTENASGAIFMDSAAEEKFDSRYAIIYGHNMRSGSRMFGTLKNYKDYGYFQSHQTIDIYTETGHETYKVFAQFDADVPGFIYVNVYPDDEWLGKIIEYSLYDCPFDTGYTTEDFKEDAHIITLSTCTDEFNEAKRYVVMLVREDGLK